MKTFTSRTGMTSIALGLATSVLVIAALVAAIGYNTVQRAHLTPVKVVMGYIPNVQFAPFYVAVKLGYYRAAGLDVRFNYASEPNALRLLSQGSIQFVDSGGDSVLAAGAAGLHVKYVLTQYSRFPSTLFFLKGRHIRNPSDLKGKTIGVPGEYGSSYYGLLTLLADSGVGAKSVKIEPIGYTQVPEVASGKVDAAMGYAPNEPVELRNQGRKVGEFDIFHWANIAGAGIATSDSLISRDSSLVRGFVRATLRGLRFTIAHPGRAFAMARASIPGLTQPELQRKVLIRAVDFWRPAGVPLGYMDSRVWKRTASILLKFKAISRSISPQTVYTNRFVR